jgi:undecaprenyl-phosphate galactose phosphotransferase
VTAAYQDLALKEGMPEQPLVTKTQTPQSENQEYPRALVVLALVGLDVLSLAMSLILAFAIRFYILPWIFPHLALGMFPSLGKQLLLVLGAGTFCLAYDGLYSRRLPFWREAKHLVKQITLAFLVAFTTVSLGKMNAEVSRMMLITGYLLAVIFIPLGRYLGKRILTYSGIWSESILIMGAGTTGEKMADVLSDPYLGYRVTGFLEDDPAKRLRGMYINNKYYPILGGFKDAVKVIEGAGIRHVVIAAPGLPGSVLVDLTNYLQPLVKSLLIVPDLFGLPVSGVKTDYFMDERILGFRTRNNLSNPINVLLKRAFDLAAGCFIMVCILPIMAIVALAIKLNSPGTIIFSHNRLGKGGREFKCHKFRTMATNAEQVLQSLLASNPALREEWEKDFKLRDDPRITRVGKFLRATSLDELPQIFNVIKGEMSLVGPRPRPLYELEAPDPTNNFKTGIDVLPGITGLWQVSGRSDLDFQKRLRLEAWYVRNWSLWLDISILFQTIPAVVIRNGAY